MDRRSRPYPLDRTHHLLRTLWMRYGPRLPQLLQLPHRLLSPPRRFRPSGQFRPAITVWCRIPTIRFAHVQELGCQLGLYLDCFPRSSLCSSASVSRFRSYGLVTLTDVQAILPQRRKDSTIDKTRSTGGRHGPDDEAACSSKKQGRCRKVAGL